MTQSDSIVWIDCPVLMGLLYKNIILIIILILATTTLSCSGCIVTYTSSITTPCSVACTTTNNYHPGSGGTYHFLGSSYACVGSVITGDNTHCYYGNSAGNTRYTDGTKGYNAPNNHYIGRRTYNQRLARCNGHTNVYCCCQPTAGL
jgi:hypothetical protein